MWQTYLRAEVDNRFELVPEYLPVSELEEAYRREQRLMQEFINQRPSVGIGFAARQCRR